MKPILLTALLFAVTACASSTEVVDDAPAVTAPSALESSAASPRDFDFWVGEWDCFGRDGTLNGTNEVTLDYGERVLQEHWRGAGGGNGTSLNMFDPVTGLWHQTWVDDSGTLLQLDGGLDADGRMVLEGTRPRRDGGGEVLHRISFNPEGETVHQLWQYSVDGGANWQIAADLIYRARE